MPMQYDPNDASDTIPAGRYDATIERVVDKVSKSSGKEMQVVTLKCYGPRELLVDDYIVNPATLFKLKKIAKSLGKVAEFDAGKFQLDDNIGENLVVELDIESDPDYGDKNRVKGYYAKETAAVSASSGEAPADDDDSIPF